ncbi:hypothetical protein CB1_000602002 [Camelus ferus]|nr:hypothetical protein CB1_000602002 [Camelus ferus]
MRPPVPPQLSSHFGSQGTSPSGDADVAVVASSDGESVHYHYGPKDLVTILFYVFITIILHAVVQEYILDKISKRLHLSKVKHSKFNESGQLVVFHLSSVIWCFYVVVTEEVPRQLQYICLYLVHIAGAYLLNLQCRPSGTQSWDLSESREPPSVILVCVDGGGDQPPVIVIS